MSTIDRARSVATAFVAAVALALYAAPNATVHPGAAPEVAEAQTSDPSPSDDAAHEDVDASTEPVPLTPDGPPDYPPRSQIDAATLDDAGVDRVVVAASAR
jgi:hypothetical protein